MAGFYEDNLIDRVREAANILEIIGGYVTLKLRGVNSYWGKCPFHGEKTASFQVRPDRGMFHCFGCGKGGNVFNFIMEMEGITFPEALNSLAERAGIELPRQTNTAAAQKIRSVIDQIYSANQIALKWFQDNLLKPSRSSEASKAYQYLNQRGITGELIKQHGIGWAESGWDGLIKYGAQKAISGAILGQAGLANQRRDGTGYVDRFRSRIMFPIVNLSGKPVAFGGRRVDGVTPDDDVAKYVNSPETQVYKKGEQLYGLFSARDNIRRDGLAYLVEGYIDWIALIRSGINNAVASLGTALTEQQAVLLKRFCSRVHILYDSDNAGINATLRAADICIKHGFDVGVIQLPEGEDPDSVVQRMGSEALIERINKPMSLIKFRLKVLRVSGSNSQQQILNAAKEILQTIRLLDDPLARDMMIEELATTSGIQRIALDQSFAQIEYTKFEPDSNRTATVLNVPTEVIAERDLISVLLAYPELIEDVVELIGLDDITYVPLKSIYQLLEQSIFKGQKINTSELPDHITDSELRAYISRSVIAGETMTIDNARIAIDGCIRILMKRKKLLKKSELEHELSFARQRGENVYKILQELNAITREIRQLDEVADF